MTFFLSWKTNEAQLRFEAHLAITFCSCPHVQHPVQLLLLPLRQQPVLVGKVGVGGAGDLLVPAPGAEPDVVVVDQVGLLLKYILVSNFVSRKGGGNGVPLH